MITASRIAKHQKIKRSLISTTNYLHAILTGFQRAFSMDERIAWGLIAIKDSVFEGETLEDWYPLTGKQGEDKEGMINLVFAYRVGKMFALFIINEVKLGNL